jgi:TRAP-type mannitol/chloroaromatic compound transport system permease small subunit
MEKFAGVLERLNSSIGNTLCWAALGMLMLQFVIVLLRYVFGYSFIFLDEGVLYFHAAIFMLGAGYTFLVNAPLYGWTFSMPRQASARRPGSTSLAICVLLTPALLILLWFSWPTVRSSWAILEGPISVAGSRPPSCLKTLIPAYCILLLVQGAAALICDISRLKATAA